MPRILLLWSRHGAFWSLTYLGLSNLRLGRCSSYLDISDNISPSIGITIFYLKIYVSLIIFLGVLIYLLPRVLLWSMLLLPRSWNL